MFRNIIYLTSLIQALLVLFLAGCQPAERQPEETQSMPALANPASVYCQGLGFQEETRQNELGSYGVCIFPDGSECDSWDFLAGRCGQEQSYCVQQGYTMQETEANIATCVFDDGSSCDEYQYFQGECQPGDNLP